MFEKALYLFGAAELLFTLGNTGVLGYNPPSAAGFSPASRPTEASLAAKSCPPLISHNLGVVVTCHVNSIAYPCDKSLPVGTTAWFQCGFMYIPEKNCAPFPTQCQPDGTWSKTGRLHCVRITNHQASGGQTHPPYTSSLTTITDRPVALPAATISRKCSPPGKAAPGTMLTCYNPTTGAGTMCEQQQEPGVVAWYRCPNAHGDYSIHSVCQLNGRWSEQGNLQCPKATTTAKPTPKPTTTTTRRPTTATWKPTTAITTTRRPTTTSLWTTTTTTRRPAGPDCCPAPRRPFMSVFQTCHNPENGGIIPCQINKQKIGTMAWYRCSDPSVKPSFTVCQSNGQWSNFNQPMCSHKPPHHHNPQPVRPPAHPSSPSCPSPQGILRPQEQCTCFHPQSNNPVDCSQPQPAGATAEIRCNNFHPSIVVYTSCTPQGSWSNHPSLPCFENKGFKGHRKTTYW